MQNVIRTGVFLAGALLFTLNGIAQKTTQTDVALTYTLEHSQVAQADNRFWMNGGSLDGAFSFFKGLGVAANVTGEHASHVAAGVGFSKVAFMAGPRYTFDTSRDANRMMKKHAVQVFGEVLFGGVHGFDSLFPANSGVASTANAFSMQVGGGADLSLAKGFGLRLLELDLVHTLLPNDAANSQNDLRLAFGISYRR